MKKKGKNSGRGSEEDFVAKPGNGVFDVDLQADEAAQYCGMYTERLEKKCEGTDFVIVKVQHGEGQLQSSQGTFQGSWSDGQMISGSYSFADGSHYKGSFKNNLFHGNGCLRSPNGDFFEGTFSRGKMHGFGIFESNATNLRFEGLFAENQFVQGKASALSLRTQIDELAPNLRFLVRDLSPSGKLEANTF